MPPKLDYKADLHDRQRAEDAAAERARTAPGRGRARSLTVDVRCVRNTAGVSFAAADVDVDVDGQHYAYSIVFRPTTYCTEPLGVAEFSLGREYREFTVIAGILDDARESEQVGYFDVSIDGVAQPQPRATMGKPVRIDVDVTGVLRLRLQARRQDTQLHFVRRVADKPAARPHHRTLGINQHHGRRLLGQREHLGRPVSGGADGRGVRGGHVALFAWLFQVRSGVVPALIALGVLAGAVSCAALVWWPGSTLTAPLGGRLARSGAVTFVGVQVAVFVGAVTEALESGVDLDFAGFLAVPASFPLVAGLLADRAAVRWACGSVLAAAVVVGPWLPTTVLSCAEDVADEPAVRRPPHPRLGPRPGDRRRRPARPRPGRGLCWLVRQERGDLPIGGRRGVATIAGECALKNGECELAGKRHVA